MDRIAEISYYLSNCIDASKPVVDDNFVFVFFCLSKTVHRCILRLTQSNCSSAKLSTSVLIKPWFHVKIKLF